MHRSDSALKNDTHKQLWDFEIRSPNLGQNSMPFNNEQKREDFQYCGLYCPGRPQSGVERRRKEQ